MNEAMALLAPEGGPMLAEDAWRMRESFFGPLRTPQAAEGCLLLVGARSGLEAALAAQANPATRIFVVEPDRALRTRAAIATAGRAHGFATLNEALAGGLPAMLDLVRIDLAAFCPDMLRTLLAERQVGHLCGEASEQRIDALALHRLARRHVRSFYLHLAEAGYSIAADQPAPEIELSVVVPACNVAAWLDTALASLQSQRLDSLEVIVVDDGSTDATGAVADAWATRYPSRFRVLHQANRGLAGARMAGMALARGEYIGFLDGDDWAEPEMFEALYRAAVLRGAEIAECGYYEAFPDGTRLEHRSAWPGDGPDGTGGLVTDPRLLLAGSPAVVRRIYRRDFLLANDICFPEHITWAEDVPFFFLALGRAGRVGIVPACLYAYRQQRSGQLSAARGRELFAQFAMLDWLAARVLPWADRALLDRFAMVQIAVHRHALARLEKPLRWRYLLRALQQMHALGGGTVAPLRALLPALRHTQQ